MRARMNDGTKGGLEWGISRQDSELAQNLHSSTFCIRIRILQLSIDSACMDASSPEMKCEDGLAAGR